jgi:hypothetical protein
VYLDLNSTLHSVKKKMNTYSEKPNEKLLVIVDVSENKSLMSLMADEKCNY